MSKTIIFTSLLLFRLCSVWTDLSFPPLLLSFLSSLFPLDVASPSHPLCPFLSKLFDPICLFPLPLRCPWASGFSDVETLVSVLTTLSFSIRRLWPFAQWWMYFIAHMYRRKCYLIFNSTWIKRWVKSSAPVVKRPAASHFVLVSSTGPVQWDQRQQEEENLIECKRTVCKLDLMLLFVGSFLPKDCFQTSWRVSLFVGLMVSGRFEFQFAVLMCSSLPLTSHLKSAQPKTFILSILQRWLHHIS